MRLTTLRDFMAVAERRGLRAAALQLEVAQPSLSRSIRELEKELGVTLFERSARGMRLTAAGEAFHRRIVSVQNNLRLAQEELDQLRGAPDGRVRVGLTSVSQMSLLPKVLEPFRARFPGVAIDVVDAVFPRMAGALLDGSVDCYVGPLAEEIVAPLQAERLFRNRRVIVGRRGHPLSAATSLAELVGAEWITGSVTHADEEEIAPLFLLHGLSPPRIALKTYSGVGILTTMLQSDLLMLLAEQWLSHAPWRDLLGPIAVREALPSSPPTCLVHRADIALTPAAECFCALVREVAAAIAPPASPISTPHLHIAPGVS